MYFHAMNSLNQTFDKAPESIHCERRGTSTLVTFVGWCRGPTKHIDEKRDVDERRSRWGVFFFFFSVIATSWAVLLLAKNARMSPGLLSVAGRARSRPWDLCGHGPCPIRLEPL